MNYLKVSCAHPETSNFGGTGMPKLKDYMTFKCTIWVLLNGGYYSIFPPKSILLAEENISSCHIAILTLWWWLLSCIQADFEFIILLNSNDPCVQVVQFYHSGSLCALVSVTLLITYQVFTNKINFLFPESSSQIFFPLNWAIIPKSSSICHFSKSGISK